MIDVNALRGIIVSKGYSQRKIAKQLGMTEKTFYSKMRKGIFESDEIEQMIIILKIENAMDIFFKDIVTYKATKE